MFPLWGRLSIEQQMSGAVGGEGCENGQSRSQSTQKSEHAGQAGVQLSQHLRESSETAPHPVQLLGGGAPAQARVQRPFNLTPTPAPLPKTPSLT